MSGTELKRSKLFNVLDVLGNLFVLNLVYILFSLPVITIGASTSALYTVTIRMVRKEDGTIWSAFLKAFKINFKKATGIWLIIAASFCILFAQYLVVLNYPGTLANIYLAVLVVEVIIIMLVIPFLFPLQAKFENSVTGTIKNSFLLAVSNLGSAIKILVAWVGPMGISVIYPKVFLFTWYFWLIFMFALIAYMASFSANKVFNRILENSKKAKDDKEA